MYPPDIELARDEPATTFEQLVAGDPAGGRTTFIIEDEPGIGRDLRIAFGPERQTIMLRARIGGDERDERSRAKQNLAFEGILTAVTLLTPGPLDDIPVGAARGLTAGQRANMPGWRKIAIDMEEVASGHMHGGWRLSPGNKKDLFSSTMSKAQVERAIRHAYRAGEVLHSQGGERVLVRGPFGNGRIEMWVNKKTKIIESAWPKF